MGPVRGWRAAFPPAQWLPAYRLAWLKHDAIAGITLAAYATPQVLVRAERQVRTSSSIPSHIPLRLLAAPETRHRGFHLPRARRSTRSCNSIEEFSAHIRTELVKWKRAVEAAGVKVQ